VSRLPSGVWIERLVRYQKVGTFWHNNINLGAYSALWHVSRRNPDRNVTEFGWCDWFRIYTRHYCCRRSSTSVSKSWRAGDAAAPRSLVCIYTYLRLLFFRPDFTLPGHTLPELFVPSPPPGHLPGTLRPLITFFFSSLFSALGLLGGHDSGFGRLQEKSKKKQKSQIIYLVTYYIGTNPIRELMTVIWGSSDCPHFLCFQACLPRQGYCV